MRAGSFDQGTCRLSYRDRGEGPLIVALHGFPDTLATWDRLADDLAAAGYRVVALALRGYPPSTVPRDGDYGLGALGRDVAALLDHLSCEAAVVIGHDWGAGAAYAFAALYPQRARCLITLADPPPLVFPKGLAERLARPHNIYLTWGRLALWWLRRRNFAHVRVLYRKWSPRWAPSEAHFCDVVAALSAPANSQAALSYYTAGIDREARARLSKRIETPALLIYGADEPRVRRESYLNAAAAVGDGSRVIKIEGVGHWPHLEAPIACRDAILSFLRGRVPTTQQDQPG